MRRLMLLAAALVPFAAHGSTISGDQFTVAQFGTADEPIYVVWPNILADGRVIADAPECNTDQSYVFKGRAPRAFITVTLLSNLQARGVWKGVPHVRITGTGGCSQLRGSEDVRAIEFYDGDQSVFLLGDTVWDQINNALTYLGSLGNHLRFDERPTFDPNHAAPPYLRSMEPASRPLLKSAVLNFHSDLCSIKLTDAVDKWATRGTKLSEVDRLVFNHLPSLLGVPGLMTATQKASCAALQAGYKKGINQYTEYIRDDAASVIWRDDNGHFHGMAFFKENGNWKVDLTNGY